MRRRDGFDKGIIFLLIIVLIVVGTGVFLYAQIRTDKVSELVKKGAPFTVAIFVTDTSHLVGWRDAPQNPAGAPLAAAASGNGSSSAGTPAPSGANGATTTAAARKGQAGTAGAGNASLFFTELLTYDPKTERGALLDIPDNVGSLIDSLQKIERIDVLFRPGKVDPFRSKLESLVGTSIPLYVEMDITKIPKIVDLLGGLNIFIANPVEQTSTNPMVLLPSGSVTLDGSKVQSFLSYKSPTDSDIEIISRRQRFVQALLKALGEHSGVFEKAGVYPVFKSWLTTDMNRRSLESFISLMSKLDTQRLIFQRVLGVERTVDHQQLLFPHYDGRLLRETMHQTLATLSNPKARSEQALSARLQILNGTTINGLAHRTSQIFESFGYDVISVGNASNQDYSHTVIIDRNGNLPQAQKVASVIRCTQIESQPPAAPPAPGVTAKTGVTPKTATAAQATQTLSAVTSPYDVTVILGKDFDGRYCK